MRRHAIPSLLAIVAAALCLAGPASAQALVIGIAAPLTGPAAVLGRQIEAGAQAAVEAITDREVELVVRDDACSAQGGEAAAESFAVAQVDIVVGFLCIESIAAAMPALTAAGIPVITPGVRVDSLTDGREKSGWPVFRTAPRDDAERLALAEKLIPLWRTELFAIIDDGTIYGRELAESFRAATEETGLKPVFVDTFRPQLENQVGLVGRLRRAGATHVFAGGDREDLAIMGRDARRLDYALTIAGGEALRAAPVNTALAMGTLMIAPPRWADLASRDVLARLTEAGRGMDGYVLPTYASVEIAVAAAGEAETSERTIAAVLDARPFNTAIGPIRFDAKGDLAENPYRLYRFDGRDFVEIEAP